MIYKKIFCLALFAVSLLMALPNGFSNGPTIGDTVAPPFQYQSILGIWEPFQGFPEVLKIHQRLNWPWKYIRLVYSGHHDGLTSLEMLGYSSSHRWEPLRFINADQYGRVISRGFASEGAKKEYERAITPVKKELYGLDHGLFGH